MPAHQGHAHHQHAMVNDGAVSGQAQAADHGRRTVDEDACPKCCGVCILSSVMPQAPQWTVAPAVSRIIFDLPNEQLRGCIVFVDPDIPKHAV